MKMHNQSHKTTTKPGETEKDREKT